MSDSEELKLSERVRSCAYIAPSPPHALNENNPGELEVLPLAWVADEIAALERLDDESDRLRSKMADILSRTAVALRGPEPELTRWSWHDLPELVDDLTAQLAEAIKNAYSTGYETAHNHTVEGHYSPEQSLEDYLDGMKEFSGSSENSEADSA